MSALVLAVPESVFVMFQLTFAAITPALIVGALLTGVFASAALGGEGQCRGRGQGVAGRAAGGGGAGDCLWSGGVTALALWAIGRMTALRVGMPKAKPMASSWRCTTSVATTSDPAGCTLSVHRQGTAQ